tara:strand:+ start:316 stop:549 length:234 start_codon:yes stop_codon:yes gene_type:complete
VIVESFTYQSNPLKHVRFTGKTRHPVVITDFKVQNKPNIIDKELALNKNERFLTLLKNKKDINNIYNMIKVTPDNLI